MSNDQRYVLISNVLHAIVHQLRQETCSCCNRIVHQLRQCCNNDECQNCMKEHVRYLCNKQRNGGPCGMGGQSWAMWDGRSKLGHVGQEVKVELFLHMYLHFTNG